MGRMSEIWEGGVGVGQVLFSGLVWLTQYDNHQSLTFLEPKQKK